MTIRKLYRQSPIKRLLSTALVDIRASDAVTSSGAVTRMLNSGNRNQSCYFNGTNAYVSTPDSGALELTGDVQTWTFYGVAASDFTPAAFQALAGQWVGAGTQSWIVDIDNSPAGGLHVWYSIDGTSTLGANSTVAPTLTDGQSYDIKVDRVASTGVWTFYTAPAGGTFVQLGAPVAGTSGALFNSTASLVIGAYSSGTSPFTGTIQRFTLHDDDRLAAEWDARLLTDYSASTLTSGGAVYTSTNAIYRDPYDLDVVLGTGANLRYQPANSLLLDGVSGSYVSTPDSPAASVTGDCILYGYVQPVDNTPGGLQTIIAKWNVSGGNYSYLLGVDNTPVSGALQFSVSIDGSSPQTLESTVATGIADGVGYWAFAVLDTGTDIKFYTSTADASVSIGVAFAAASQLGAAVSAAAITSVYDGAAGVEIGATASGTGNFFNGLIHRAGVISGLDATATPAVDFNPTGAGNLSGTASDTFFGAEMPQVEWTLAGGARISNQDTVQSYGSAGIETTVAPALITTPMTMFLVGKTDLLDGSIDSFSSSRDNAGTEVGVFIAASGAFNVNAGATISAGIGDTAAHLHTVRHNGDASSQYTVNGIGTVTLNMGTESLQYGTLFNSSGVANPLSGSISRHIIFDRKLTDEETSYVQYYLTSSHVDGYTLNVPVDNLSTAIVDIITQQKAGTIDSETGSLSDLKKKSLIAMGYSGTIQDMEKQYLIALGYDGSLDDMGHEYWEDYS